ncbi:MAG: TfoX/Sxy family protein [Rhodospirillales bacterium]
MTASPAFCAHLVDLMSGLGPISVRRMFGGAGLYHLGAMFALVFDDTLYLKVDDLNRPDFEEAGMGAFTYDAGGGPISMSYYQAPPEAMEDGELMRAWALKAVAAALGAKAARRKAAPRAQKPAKKRGRRRD